MAPGCRILPEAHASVQLSATAQAEPPTGTALVSAQAGRPGQLLLVVTRLQLQELGSSS